MVMAPSGFGGAISNYPNVERPKTVAVCQVTFGWGARDPVNILPIYQGSESDVGVGWRVCHFSSSSMRILARGIDSGGGGRRPSQIESVATRFRGRGPRGGFNNKEVAGGSEGPRRASLLRQALQLLRKCCRAVQAGSLMDSSVLFSLDGS